MARQKNAPATAPEAPEGGQQAGDESADPQASSGEGGAPEASDAPEQAKAAGDGADSDPTPEASAEPAAVTQPPERPSLARMLEKFQHQAEKDGDHRSAAVIAGILVSVSNLRVKTAHAQGKLKGDVADLIDQVHSAL